MVDVLTKTIETLDSATEKKEKNSTKIRRKRSKSQGKRRSSKKDTNNDKSEDLDSNGDKGSNRELKIEIKDNATTLSSQEFNDQAENPDTEEKDEDAPIQHHVAKVPTRTRSKKAKKKSLSKGDKSDHGKHLNRPRRNASDASSDKFDEDEQDEKIRVSGRSLKSTRSRNSTKEDKKPSVPRRVSERDDNSVGKPSSGRSLGKKLRQKDKSSEESQTKNPDKLPTKPGRRTRRVSPDSKSDDEEDDLNVGSFHSLRKDSDKPRRRSRSSSGKKRSSKSSRKSRSKSRSRSRSKSKTSGSGRIHRRKLKDKSVKNSDETAASIDTEASDDIDDDGTQEVYLKDEESSTTGSQRSRRERRKDRERLSNGEGRKLKNNSSHGSRMSRGPLSSRREAMRKSHSERWNRAVETMDTEGSEGAPVARRRARASDGLSKSAHSRVRRNNSSGLSRLKGSLSNRSYHGVESDRRTSSDGRRTPRRVGRRHQVAAETASSVGDDSIDSFGDTHSFGDSRSQGTLESIDDFEDFGEDYYGMEMQTPGMVDFEEEMLDLMQRANPEVTDHLDRRVHRKREMVAYDHNMPMMTRQALLTRQASSQVQRQFIDGSSIDKNRLLLRNDSMQSNSSHRGMRSSHHGRRAPPRAKSSGLGAMNRGGYEGDDRRGVFRSRSGQTASFNQYYQNKPNKVRNLSRRASGDLVQPNGLRGQTRSSEHRRRPVQRAASTTALRRSSSADYMMSPQKPIRKMSDDRLDSPSEEDKDMSNKRNRSKLHLLMYMTKMNVDMDDLFKKVREGETPRSPIDSLRMPSP